MHARFVHRRRGKTHLRSELEVEAGMLGLVREKRSDFCRDRVGVNQAGLGTSASSKAEELLGYARDVVFQHFPALSYPEVAVVANPGAHHVHAPLETHDDVLDSMGKAGHCLADGRQTLGSQLLLFQKLDVGDVCGDLHGKVDLLGRPDDR